MKNLRQFMERGNALGRLQLAARQLEALARRIRDALPPEAGEHVTGCAVRAGTVVVFVDNAAWASRLRYMQQEILTACQEYAGPGIRHIQFRILVSEPAPESPSATGISTDSRHLLRQAASGVADDELAEALRRLAEKDDQDAD